MIITLTGENDFLRTRELQTTIIGSFIAEHGELGLERLDGEEANYERMLESVQSLPFLASRKLIILRTPGANKQFSENVEQFLGDVAETNDVVLVEPKLDKRLSYYKTLKKQTDFREFSALDERGLASFLENYASEQGGKLSRSDAARLVERVGTNQQLLLNELDKLLAYDSNITSVSIELLTEKTPRSSIFDLLDVAFAGNSKRAIELYKEQRALKVEPQQLLAMLVWQLHVLALIQAGRGRSTDDIARQAGISPFVVRKAAGLAAKITATKLKQLITLLRELDTQLKTETVNADDAVQFYLLSLA